MPIASRTPRIALFLVLALCLPVAARADEASHRAKAQELMNLLHTDKMVQQIADNLMKQITDVADKAVGPTPTPDAKAKAADFEKQAFQIIDAQVGWKAMQPGFADIYLKNFTEEEMDAIIVFYKSPAGSELLAKMPDVNTEIGKLGGSRVQTLQPQLQQLYTDFHKSVSTAPPQPTLGPVSPAAPSASPAATPK